PPQDLPRNRRQSNNLSRRFLPKTPPLTAPRPAKQKWKLHPALKPEKPKQPSKVGGGEEESSSSKLSRTLYCKRSINHLSATASISRQ
uniref:Uncharacterized protein n=1 Tax=Oryza brachyantha TaxID=4533 RepID=J3LTX8_ORYBR